MSNKLLAFLGLAGDDADSRPSSRRRSNYLGRLERIVVNEDDDDADDSTPVKGYTVVRDDPLTEDAPVSASDDEDAFATAKEAPQAGASRLSEEQEEEDETPPRAERGRHAAPGSPSLADKLRGFGDSLRRRAEDDSKTLILVRRGALDMLEDIEEALLEGRTVLLDFEKEDKATAACVVTRIVNFIRVRGGNFYTVNSTSLLLSLGKSAVMEWRVEEDSTEA